MARSPLWAGAARGGAPPRGHACRGWRGQHVTLRVLRMLPAPLLLAAPLRPAGAAAAAQPAAAALLLQVSAHRLGRWRALAVRPVLRPCLAGAGPN